ncbi:hypothetical protein [Arthrobacter sp. 260]|uniref:hypothetical protein n=1 Tax=Arthrobacter sp. 260 TaxID=2735314 RepID=UPI0014920DE1|nr:hypothetical protein [Arthrobacter sp. 260]NOJ60748.1 hypothetical protein [Arthrobacter sp. 260]
MQLAAWVILCGGFALSFRSRPAVSLVAILTLWFLVPTVGSPLITGQPTGPLSMHAATWLIVATFVVQLERDPAALFDTVARHIYAFLALGVVIAAAVLTTLTRIGGGGTVLLVDQIIAPVMFFLLVLATAHRTPALVSWLRIALLSLAAIVSAVAVAQWFSESVLFYEDGFLTQYWFNPDNRRWMGVLDQPLTLSMAMCVLAPLVAGARAVIQVPLLALMSTAVMVSQSRVGLVIFILVLAYLVLFSRTGPFAKVGMVLALSAAGAALLATPVAEGLLGRIEDDTGSFAARSEATASFFASWTDYLMVGSGIGSSYGVAEESGLSTSLESSILMYSVDLGIVFAVLYFGVLLAFVLKYANRTGVRGLGLAALLAVLIPQTFSALGTRSAAGILMWAVIAMLVAAGEHQARRAPRDDRVPGQSAPLRAVRQ